jgi:spore coat protein JC
MWNYEKRLEYPVNISRPNVKMAKLIITQFGGPDGELGASQRYLSQRYTMSNRNVQGLLTDIGVSVPKLHLSSLNRCSGSFHFRSIKIFQ